MRSQSSGSVQVLYVHFSIRFELLIFGISVLVPFCSFYTQARFTTLQIMQKKCKLHTASYNELTIVTLWHIFKLYIIKFIHERKNHDFSF